MVPRETLGNLLRNILKQNVFNVTLKPHAQPQIVCLDGKASTDWISGKLGEIKHAIALNSMKSNSQVPLKSNRQMLTEREFFIDNLLVRIHFIIEMIWWTGLAPWEF